MNIQMYRRLLDLFEGISAEGDCIIVILFTDVRPHV